MSTSATITNRMVRNSSLPDRPMRGACARVGAGCPLAGSVTGSKKSSTENPEPADDAPPPRAGQTGREEVDRGAFPDLRQRRIRQDHPGQRPDIQSLRDRQRPCRDQLSRLRAHDGRAKDDTFRRSDDLYMTMHLALGLGAVIVVIGPAQHTKLELACARLRFADADMRA